MMNGLMKNPLGFESCRVPYSARRRLHLEVSAEPRGVSKGEDRSQDATLWRVSCIQQRSSCISSQLRLKPLILTTSNVADIRCHHSSPCASEHVLNTLSPYLAIQILQTQVDAHRQKPGELLQVGMKIRLSLWASGRLTAPQSLISPRNTLSSPYPCFPSDKLISSVRRHGSAGASSILTS